MTAFYRAREDEPSLFAQARAGQGAAGAAGMERRQACDDRQGRPA